MKSLPCHNLLPRFGYIFTSFHIRIQADKNPYLLHIQHLSIRKICDTRQNSQRVLDRRLFLLISQYAEYVIYTFIASNIHYATDKHAKAEKTYPITQFLNNKNKLYIINNKFI